MTEAREPRALHPERGLGCNHDAEALSFKVPFRFRHFFKFHALQRNLTMTEFLVAAVEAYVAAERPPERLGLPGAEIRK